MKENEFTRILIKNAINILGSDRIWAFKMVGTPYARAGIPDIIMSIDDRLLLIECKKAHLRKDQTLAFNISPLQIQELAKATKAKVPSFIGILYKIGRNNYYALYKYRHADQIFHINTCCLKGPLDDLFHSKTWNKIIELIENYEEI